MRACLSPVILDKVKRVPGTCSLKTSGGDRTGVDLVCVIDVSGSMGGQKIDLVKQTLLYIIDLLNENDRLSLITFTGSANKLAHLVRVNETHKPSLKHIMSNIQAGGGTAISSGLQAALDTLGERKHVNSVSSVFLLSDGEDGTLEECRNLLSKKSSGVYTLHSFGFGKDHDSNLLTELASQKDGNFYYIPKIEKVD
jgi:Mg-chelatase subunit ChlD